MNSARPELLHRGPVPLLLLLAILPMAVTS